MEAKHSLVSPSNFERRMLCPGSLAAEKDMPNTSSKYSKEGTLLHEKTTAYIMSNSIGNGLTEDQKTAVKDAGDYFFKLRDSAKGFIYEFHETTYDLSFIYPDMKGTADSVLIIEDPDQGCMELHVIDYKFGKGIAVSAYQNFQLILYYLGVKNNPRVKKTIENKCVSVHLHIVQPFIKNSRWDLTDDEVVEVNDMSFYLDVVKTCYDPSAKRIPNKKACQFCKAKPTCPALAKTLPDLDVDVFDLEDKEIATIFDNRELIKLYLVSIEEYIKNKLSTEEFEGYVLMDKISNRKWNGDALIELPKILGDRALETSTKLIAISKAEKLLGKNSDIINKLTMKEVIGEEIIKTNTYSK